MAFETMRWSPHPFWRPGFHVVAALHVIVGLALVADGVFDGRIASGDVVLGAIVALVTQTAVAAALLVPRPRQRVRWRLAYVVAAPVVALALFLMLRLGVDATVDAPTMPGLIATASGIGFMAFAEARRRAVQLVLERDHLTVFVRRYRLEHELPLESVEEVEAVRSFWGRIWGYSGFVAHARRGSMKGNVSKPVVGETPPDHATAENGWDEKERFHLVAAHPYRRVRRALENRIVLARMPPREREEQELAYRLTEDLAEIKA